MQVYKGLHIVTNKVTEEECRGVPHHLLGIADPNTNFTAMDFCHHASLAIQSITARNRHPIIAGGSNSFIEALVTDVPEFKSRYECCFLWVDVSLPVLHRFVSERVDRMVEAGLVEEVRRIFDPEADYSRGIRRAIGVPEMDQFLRGERIVGDKIAAQYLRKAIAKIKENTCKLACSQLDKIHRLQNIRGWKIHRLDATEAFLKRGDDAEEAWEKHVAGPSMDIVGCFLRHQDCVPNIVVGSGSGSVHCHHRLHRGHDRCGGRKSLKAVGPTKSYPRSNNTTPPGWPPRIIFFRFCFSGFRLSGILEVGKIKKEKKLRRLLKEIAMMAVKQHALCSRTIGEGSFSKTERVPT
ncbi:hypothetical protein AAG906_024826 [Vitis piasezkii]